MEFLETNTTYKKDTKERRKNYGNREYATSIRFIKKHKGIFL